MYDDLTEAIEADKFSSRELLGAYAEKRHILVEMHRVQAELESVKRDRRALKIAEAQLRGRDDEDVMPPFADTTGPGGVH